VNTLKRDWNESYGISHILLTIKCLLMVPNAESSLNEEAGRLLLEAYDDYFARARTWTSIHALKKEEKKEENKEEVEEKAVESDNALGEISANAEFKQKSSPAKPVATSSVVKTKAPVASAPKRGVKRL